MTLNWQLWRRAAVVTLFLASLCSAQKDPGVRGGPPGAGGPLPGLTQNELALFNEGKLRNTQPVNRLPPGSRATVCLATPIPAADAPTFEHGELIASRVLQLAGFRLDWRQYGKPCPADRDPILLTVLSTTPKDYFPGAFGVSWPFEGVHTQVFLDRVMLLSSAGISSPVLGHVLAHEIAHILSGTDAHSASGVMKMRWSGAELRDMAANPMRFTAPDLLLLKNGLASRHQRLVNPGIRPQQQTVTMASE